MRRILFLARAEVLHVVRDRATLAQVMVMPILQLHLALRVIFSRMLNPHHEIFGGRMLLGTALSLLGAVTLSLDTEFVLSLIPLPASLAALARWHWP